MTSEIKDSNKLDSGHIGSWGPTQSWAVVWFYGALLVGGSLTYFLSGVDHFLYQTNAETLDYNKYRNNRRSLTSIPRDSVDPRVFGDLRKAKEGS